MKEAHVEKGKIFQHGPIVEWTILCGENENNDNQSRVSGSEGKT